MNWTPPVEADLAAALSQREIDAFRASPSATADADPVAAVLEQAAGEARAACRSNGRVRLGADPASIPRSLLRAVVAIAAFDVLKRLPVPVGEDRRRAKEDALELLRRVASGSITPESDGDDGSEAARPVPLSAPARPPHLLD